MSPQFLSFNVKRKSYFIALHKSKQYTIILRVTAFATLSPIKKAWNNFPHREHHAAYRIGSPLFMHASKKPHGTNKRDKK